MKKSKNANFQNHLKIDLEGFRYRFRVQNASTVFLKTWASTSKMKDFPKMSKNQEICGTSKPRNFFPN